MPDPHPLQTANPPQLSSDLVVTDSIEVTGTRLLLTRPADPDALLDDPDVVEANARDDYMPYWAYLWPGARLLAEVVLTEKWAPGTRALEIGCGLGLVGLAGLAAGLHVTFSDYEPQALAFAAHNARQNSFAHFDTLLLDWGRPPAERYPVILGADVLYEMKLHPLVAGVVKQMLAPDGLCLLADPGREAANGFGQVLQQHGLDFERVRLARTASYLEPHGTLYCARHAPRPA